MSEPGGTEPSHQTGTVEMDTESGGNLQSAVEMDSDESSINLQSTVSTSLAKLRSHLTISPESKGDISKIADYQGSTKESTVIGEEEEVQQTNDLLAPQLQTYHQIENYRAENVQIYDNGSPKVPKEEKHSNNVEGPYIMVKNRGQKKRNKDS